MSARFWMLDNIPSYSNVWCFKTNHLYGDGLYRSDQMNPSGITLRIVVRGSWKIEMSGSSFEAQSGDIFLALPGRHIIFSQTDKMQGWEWYEIQFCGSAAESFVSEFGLYPDAPVVRPKNPELTLELFIEIYELMGSSFRREDEAMCIIFRLLRAVDAEKNSQRGRETGNLVRDAINIFETELSGRPNINEIAARLGVDRTSLFRAFVKETGRSPYEYMDDLKYKMVLELLSGSEASIASVGASAGFKDQRYFISWFRRHAAMPPGAWRKSLKR